jgi:adenine-specific DNA methylase
MRLLGNKTRLLTEIEGFLTERGVTGGTFTDIFCGTARVGRHFKSLGFRVFANDRLSMCFTKAVAEVEVNGYPSFAALREKYRKVFRSRAFGGAGGSPDLPEAARPLSDVLRLLSYRLDPEESLIYRNFCPGGGAGRMYFSDENGRHIDAILRFIRENNNQGHLSRHELYLLLSVLLDAADRVANISGTYGAYLKKFQSNALNPLRLEVPEITSSTKKHQAFHSDANELVRELDTDVLYIDPPYNSRQYAANYHVLEIIAEHHTIENLEAYETSLYGKTGLRPYATEKSAYCVPPLRGRSGGDVLSAMADLILSSRARHVLVSYNEEGLLSREQLGHILALFADTASFDFESNMRQVLYRRFRSDSDRPAGESVRRRQYKVIEGKARDEISEWLLFASCPHRQSRGGRPRTVAPTRAVPPGAS